ncbi:MAG TPA: hypothetical protein PLB52_00940 [Candidatus Moranbacteria bacterium]|nr:hypothetical protein [Candidatus Moranbacteria bacterium]
MADSFLENSAEERLLRAVNRKMSEKLSLTLSIQTKEDARILRGVVGPTDATRGATIHFIADPRLFRVKFVFAKNIKNVCEKREIVWHNCHKFLVSKREMIDGRIEYLAQDIVEEVAILLQEFVKVDISKSQG